MSSAVHPSSELEFLAPVVRTITVDGDEITIAPVSMKLVPQLVRGLEPVFALLAYEQDIDAVRLVSALGMHGEAVIEAVALCINKPPHWVGNLLPDRMAALTMVVLEVNADFFTRAVEAAKAQAPRLAPTLAAKIMAGTFPGPKDSTG